MVIDYMVRRGLIPPIYHYRWPNTTYLSKISGSMPPIFCILIALYLIWSFYYFNYLTFPYVFNLFCAIIEYMDGEIDRDITRNLLQTLLRLRVINKELYDSIVCTLIINMLKQGKI